MLRKLIFAAAAAAGIGSATAAEVNGPSGRDELLAVSDITTERLQVMGSVKAARTPFTGCVEHAMREIVPGKPVNISDYRYNKPGATSKPVHTFEMAAGFHDKAGRAVAVSFLPSENRNRYVHVVVRDFAPLRGDKPLRQHFIVEGHVFADRWGNQVKQFPIQAKYTLKGAASEVQHRANELAAKVEDCMWLHPRLRPGLR